MLTIFGNLRINDKKRLDHMKDSFLSFNSTSDNWLINVRGDYRKQAISFLKKNLGSKMVEFELLDEDRGWMVNALDMLKKAKHNYVLLWNEDHMNIAPQSLYPKMIKEMSKCDADYMLHSWWHFGKNKKDYEVLGLKELKHIDYIKLTPSRWEKVKGNGHDRYLLSSVGIFKKDFLIKLMKMEQNRLHLYFSYPIFVVIRSLNKVGFSINEKKVFPKINKHFNYKLSRYPHYTPHELEKDSSRVDILPIVMAFSKRELLCCIDDDNGVEGSQLIKRGLYPPK